MHNELSDRPQTGLRALRNKVIDPSSVRTIELGVVCGGCGKPAHLVLRGIPVDVAPGQPAYTCRRCVARGQTADAVPEEQAA